MGNACASTTQQGLTASTVPHSTTTSLGRLPTAKPEPPRSVSVSSQPGTASPEQNASSLGTFLLGFHAAADTGVVGRCLWSSSVSGVPMPRSCPASTACLYGGDGPVHTAPRLEILTRPCCLLVWPFYGTQAHLPETRSSAVGRLQPAGVPWRLQGASIVPSMGTADRHVHRRYGLLLLGMGSAHTLGTGGSRSFGLWGGLRIASAVLGRDARGECSLEGTAEVTGQSSVTAAV